MERYQKAGGAVPGRYNLTAPRRQNGSSSSTYSAAGIEHTPYSGVEDVGNVVQAENTIHSEFKQFGTSLVSLGLQCTSWLPE